MDREELAQKILFLTGQEHDEKIDRIRIAYKYGTPSQLKEVLNKYETN